MPGHGFLVHYLCCVSTDAAMGLDCGWIAVGVFAGDISLDDAVGVQQAATVLETRFGYLTAVGPSLGQGNPTDDYHIDTVWPFEQAVIHAGALRHGLSHTQAV